MRSELYLFLFTLSVAVVLIAIHADQLRHCSSPSRCGTLLGFNHVDDIRHGAGGTADAQGQTVGLRTTATGCVHCSRCMGVLVMAEESFYALGGLMQGRLFPESAADAEGVRAGRYPPNKPGEPDNARAAGYGFERFRKFTREIDMVGENFYPGEPLEDDPGHALSTGTPFPRRGQAAYIRGGR